MINEVPDHVRTTNIPTEIQASIDAANAATAAAEQRARERSVIARVMITFLLGGFLVMTLIIAQKVVDTRRLERRIFEAKEQNDALRSAVTGISFFWMDTGELADVHWIGNTLEVEDNGCPSLSFIEGARRLGIGTEAYDRFGFGRCPGTIERCALPPRLCPTP